VLSKAAAQAKFTEGKGAGKNIATFRLSTLPGPDSSALKAAYATDQRASGLYVVRSQEGPPSSITNADELVASLSERIYYVKSHKNLAYARQYLVARTDQLVTYVSYAFLATKEDPDAKQFTRASDLLAVQLKKNAKVFSRPRAAVFTSMRGRQSLAARAGHACGRVIAADRFYAIDSRAACSARTQRGDGT
jgi:hypothetical protein